MSQTIHHDATPTTTITSEPGSDTNENEEFLRCWNAAESAVRRALRQRIRDPELLKDLTQTTLLKAMREFYTSPERIRNFRGLCIQIARNLAIDAYRKSSRDVLKSSCQIEGHNEPPARSSPEDLTETLRDMLREFLPQLPARERAVAQGVIAGMTADEIGVALRRTPRRIRQIVDAIGERVAKFFGRDWF